MLRRVSDQPLALAVFASDYFLTPATASAPQLDDGGVSSKTSWMAAQISSVPPNNIHRRERGRA